MKQHLLYLSFAAMALLASSSCTTDYGKCSGDTMYHQHNFELQSVFPSYLEGHDGWLKEKCTKCGLEYAYNANLKYTKHYGSVCLIKSPSTNNFTEWCIQYYNQGENVLHIEPISKNDVIVEIASSDSIQ